MAHSVQQTKLFCACDPCLLLRTDECLLPHLVTKAVRAQAPLAKGVALRTPQLVSLTLFADWLDSGMIVAVKVDESEQALEGPYWLALIKGSAFVLDEDTVHSGHQYRKDWIVVRAQWYALKQHSERGYELLPAEVSE